MNDQVSRLGDHSGPVLRTPLPGPRARRTVAEDEQVTSPSLPRAYPCVPVRGEGCLIEDADGNVLLDFNAGIATNSTGHAHPRVVAAVQEQAARLLHYCSSDFYVPVYAELCARLAGLSPFGEDARVFLANSGTEAVEASLKLARRHTGRPHVVSFLGSFHGRTYGSVSVTGSKHTYRDGFGPLPPGVFHAPYNDTFTHPDGTRTTVPGYLEDVLFTRLTAPEEVAAVLVEPVLGEGGYVPADADWLRGLRALCDRHGILLIADEVQTGCGRTGAFWACDRYGVTPDILLAGKGLASGLPLSAMIARAGVMDWPVGTHGSTFGGNPVSCAAALATADLVTGSLAENALKQGAFLLDRLQHLADGPHVESVTGLGLMIGVTFASARFAAEVEAACFRRGLLVLQAGDRTVRVSPPLVLREDQAAAGADLLCEAVAACAAAGIR
ncbi:4-aminobutyrate aminotransferase [Streptomyces sp. Tu 6176]|uniref:aminotransferase class III-fold pyridoxal phosphate-dependent enzyme n=1 Tax=Streptomyces sp. Tu 6176 TaxID=1470557 RepID=UPI00044C20F4|nr:aminotransferase class III-fold pyridoxal phosphate-dependent enzyme [Streptomyces sp. Tu 6176]EYT81906.1 4-aminobutyrate aminotransferase [Streptomyces sp. Tu 6176]